MRCLPLCAAILLLMTTCALCQDEQPVKVGDVIFETDFEGPDALKGWNGSPKLEPGYQGGQALVIERKPEEGHGSTVAQFVLPFERVRGYVLYLSGMIKAENVTEKPNSWNGIKYMAPIVTDGGNSYPQAQVGVGTFDWQRFVFPVTLAPDATDWRLYMGLEAVTGKVWFDDLKIIVRKPPFVPKPAVTEGPIYKGHDLPRLRGAMISPNVNEESLKLFGEDWNANVVRWQLTGYSPPADLFDLDHYDKWLEDQLAKLDAGLPLCEKYGLYVVVDLHSKPGGGAETGKNLFNSPECQRKFIDNWKMMAAKYKDSKVVWGYDLANEPMENTVAEDCMDWQALVEEAAKAVRQEDPDHAIIVEPATGGGPYGFTCLNPIDVPGVVYSVHMYLPHSFTHQGVHTEWTNHYSYPGEIQGTMWDKAQLERALKPAIDFAEKYRVHMYLGEFSAIRWAPDNSAYRYLKDCIDIFEEHDWDWTYHAFREWSGWSVEHGSDKDNTQPAAEPTDRQKLLTEWFGKNEKPEW